MVIESHAYIGGTLITSVMNEPELGVDTVRLESDEFPFTAQVGVDGLIVLLGPNGERFGLVYRVVENKDHTWSISQGERMVVRTPARLTTVGALLATL